MSSMARRPSSWPMVTGWSASSSKAASSALCRPPATCTTAPSHRTTIGPSRPNSARTATETHLPRPRDANEFGACRGSGMIPGCQGAQAMLEMTPNCTRSPRSCRTTAPSAHAPCERSNVTATNSLARHLTRRARAGGAADEPPADAGAVSVSADPSREGTRRAVAIIPRRCLAVVAAVIMVAGLMTAAGTQPASAAVSDGICLTNDNGYCISGGEVEAGVIVLVINEIVGYIVAWIRYKVNGKYDGNSEYELVDSSNGECLTDTGLNVYDQAWLGPCGADGTVWVWIPDSDGYRLYSRYSIDNGYPLALTVDPLSNGAAVYLYVAEPPGGAFWQNFSYY
jgi:hypothetical protein